MSNMINHAKRELSLINEDPEFVEAYLKIVEVFAGMGHSGGSASVAIPVITTLLSMENLTPLTDNPDEWYFHGEEIWGAPGGVWQNVRNGEAFSHDGGKTYYLLSDRVDGEPKQIRKSRSYEKLKQVQAASDS